MSNDDHKVQLSNGNAVLGVILILLGIAFLGQQVFHINLWNLGWPFFVIVPGVLLFAFALAMHSPAGEPFAVIGSIVTMTGLILLYQNTTGQWASWAYAWALIVPTSIGLGQIVYGSLKNRPDVVTTGARSAMVGFIIFAIGAAFFELVLGIGGFGLGRWGWPILLIGLGILLLLRNFMFTRNKA